MMSITEFFRKLKAPLANSRWSWGGIDDAGRRVFLRAWQDQTVSINSRRYVRLAHHAAYADNPENLGYRERVRHLKAARETHEAFVVMCKAENVEVRPRTIAGFNSNEVFKIGNLIEIDGDEWGELVERIPIRNLD